MTWPAITMKNALLSLSLILLALLFGSQPAAGQGNEVPWSHGNLQVSANNRYLQHADGTPFFWLADTGWLLPERLNRDEAAYYLSRAAQAGYNVVQVQTINGVPAMNAYGQSSHPFGYDFSQVDRPGVYGYWDHMDYIVDTAARHGIYIGMVCIWGGLVKAGLMDQDQAVAYGTFLANRYKDRPNIVWIIGGDIQGSIKTEVWETLAHTIKAIDTRHLMTYHPRGRHTSATWFSQADWIDFHMFQSGHRRYGQDYGNADYPIPLDTEEDNWQYVDSTWSYRPLRPVLDGEPSYEDIPKGLHDASEPHWQANEVRRYAYWSVFAGSCGHTYGHSHVMQFAKPGTLGSYFADGAAKPWYAAMEDEGYNQMQHLKHLMLTLPYMERVADQGLIVDNGTRYERLAATRGAGYLMVYNYTGRAMTVDLTRISGAKKRVWWMDAATARLTYLGERDSQVAYFPAGLVPNQADGVLIVVDAALGYLTPEQTHITAPQTLPEAKDYAE